MVLGDSLTVEHRRSSLLRASSLQQDYRKQTKLKWNSKFNSFQRKERHAFVSFCFVYLFIYLSMVNKIQPKAVFLSLIFIVLSHIFSSESRCPTLHATPFSSLSCTNGSRPGSACTTTCAIGYRLNGTGLTECQNDLTWTNELSTCESKSVTQSWKIYSFYIHVCVCVCVCVVWVSECM